MANVTTDVSHQRICEINVTVTGAGSPYNLVVTAVNFYRTRAELAAGTPFKLTIQAPAAQAAPYELLLGEALPTPTILRFIGF